MQRCVSIVVLYSSLRGASAVGESKQRGFDPRTSGELVERCVTRESRNHEFQK